jgi:hypothetical protein
MERVTGIGGLFFRARDPAALARWYGDHLGIDPAPATYQQRPWWQQQGPTVVSPFRPTPTTSAVPSRRGC